MLSEFTIGRRAQRNAFGSFKLLKPNQPWYLIGVMGIAAAFFILAFYSTVAGWTLEYLYLSVINGFKEMKPAELQTYFANFQLNGWKPVMWQVIIMALTAGIIISGVRKGIEKYTKILMPVLLVLIIIMGIRSITLPGGMEGLRFLFEPDFSKLGPSTILEALGQAFFSLSIGMGTLITYGSYIQKKENLANTAYAVSAADTFIAILAGIAIFPAVFAFGINPSEGEALVFITLPNIFQQMAGGYFWALVFFVLLAIAALTSTISVLEVVVAFCSEELNIGRKKATVVVASIITFIGIFCTLSQGPLDELSIGDKNLFSILDYSAANIFLPVGAFFIVVFVGWFLGRRNVRDELSNQGTLKAKFFWLFLVLVRFFAPIAIAIVFLYQLDILKF
jgi:NSS family neurotransmitter:Na+ symporter